jgi:Ku protein
VTAETARFAGAPKLCNFLLRLWTNWLICRPLPSARLHRILYEVLKFDRVTLTMASRPIWRGHLRLALVSCPVALYNARHDRSAIRFNMINPDTGNRIKIVTQDSVTGAPLERGQTVKGYEFDKNRYLILKDEDFDSVKVESSAIMNVEKFVDAGSIDPMYYDASYFLAPDGKAGEDVYAVLREAIAKTGKTALTRVVISQRERTVALRPMGVGLMAHTLYEDRDLNSADQYFEDAAQLNTDPEMVDLASRAGSCRPGSSAGAARPRSGHPARGDPPGRRWDGPCLTAQRSVNLKPE